MNYLAIIAGAVINMVIGALWYSPVLFAKPWMKAMGFEKMSRKELQKGIGQKYAMMFITALVFSVILSWFIKTLGATTLLQGVQIGFLSWLGFTTTAQLGSWLFSGKPKELYFIDSSYQLIVHCVVGGLLAIWR